MTTLITHTYTLTSCRSGLTSLCRWACTHVQSSWSSLVSNFSCSSCLFPVFLPFHVQSHLQHLPTLQPPTDRPRMCTVTDGLGALTCSSFTFHKETGQHFASPCPTLQLEHLLLWGTAEVNVEQFYTSPHTEFSRVHSFLKCSPLKNGSCMSIIWVTHCFLCLCIWNYRIILLVRNW